MEDLQKELRGLWTPAGNDRDASEVLLIFYHLLPPLSPLPLPCPCSSHVHLISCSSHVHLMYLQHQSKMTTCHAKVISTSSFSFVITTSDLLQDLSKNPLFFLFGNTIHHPPPQEYFVFFCWWRDGGEQKSISDQSNEGGAHRALSRTNSAITDLCNRHRIATRYSDKKGKGLQGKKEKEGFSRLLQNLISFLI